MLHVLCLYGRRSFNRSTEQKNDILAKISLEGKLHLRQGKRQTTVSLLMALLLLSLLLAACNGSWMQVSKPQSLPTLTVEPGWKIVLQTQGNTTNQSDNKSQSFSLGRFPAGVYLLSSLSCTGQGLAGFQIKAPSYLDEANLTCMDIPQTSSGISQVDISQEQLTANLTIHGSVEWEVLIEERS